jgi:hypothetical protein
MTADFDFARAPALPRRYFTSRFPRLLMATYCFALRTCAEEPLLQKYFPQARVCILHIPSLFSPCLLQAAWVVGHPCI